MPRPRFASPQTQAALTALVEDPAGWHHGYALSRRTGLASGTLYPILRRLLDAGLVEARWATDDEGTAVAVARAAPVSPWAPPRPAQARP
jgi:DNA-binding PadR family transcriptional regulator